MGDADYLAAFDLLLDPIIAQFDPQVRALGCEHYAHVAKFTTALLLKTATCFVI
jgi:hypothetical protein